MIAPAYKLKGGSRQKHENLRLKWRLAEFRVQTNKGDWNSQADTK